MENPVPDGQIKQKVVDRMGRCGVCHHAFVPNDVHVVSRKPALWTMVVECEECHARSFVAAVLEDGDPREAREALQDLSRTEFDEVDDDLFSDAADGGDGVTVAARDTVSVEDLLDVHEFLRDFDGDFATLFKGQ